METRCQNYTWSLRQSKQLITWNDGFRKSDIVVGQEVHTQVVLCVWVMVDNLCATHRKSMMRKSDFMPRDREKAAHLANCCAEADDALGHVIG